MEHYQKDLAVCRKVFGDEHPDTAISYNNMSGVYRAMGDRQQALVYCEKALEIKKKVYGDFHPDLAISYNNVGRLYAELGNFPQALEYCRIALKISLDFYGEEHQYSKHFRQNIEVITNAAAKHAT